MRLLTDLIIFECCFAHVFQEMSQLRFGNKGFSPMKSTKSHGASPMKLMMIDLVDSPPEKASSSSSTVRGSLTKRKKEVFVDEDEEDGSNWKYGDSELCAEDINDGNCCCTFNFCLEVGIIQRWHQEGNRNKKEWMGGGTRK